jgi:hypothetical protein
MQRATVLLAMALLVAAPAIVLGAGHIVPGTFTATLSAEDEVPPPTVPDDFEGSGTATATVSVDDRIEVEVAFEGLTGDPVGAHIHWGPPGEAGPVIFPLDHAGGSPISQTLTPDDFTPAEGGPQTFEEAVEAMHAGNTYVNVHTEMNQPGEIRGQLRLVPDTATEARPTGSLAVPGAGLLLLAAGVGSLVALRRFALARG